ncbi:rhodanese-like domain-containing protein [Psychroflexus aestuariivivens]|uniref:rhodanese-like domain-containing protein n=1 Tax=Psychroflexus aestuariivivens TaxID=1795040 RepID=UPI000FD9AAAA|nr:rhodanese-like domain-containing protein [Psychroflexus aestuariivivens]
MFSIFKTKKFKEISVINANQYKVAIQKPNVQLVDVRTKNEFLLGKINGSINIDVLRSDFETKIDKFNKSEPIYIYCRSGNRSQKAARIMVSIGFQNIIDLEGGYIKWIKNN